MDKIHVNNELIERIKPELQDPEHLYVLGVAVGHIHDILYEEYDDVIYFTDSSGLPIEVKVLTQPDGLRITLAGHALEVDTMGGHLIDALPKSENVSDKQLEDLLILISELYDLLIEYGVEPLLSHTYD